MCTVGQMTGCGEGNAEKARGLVIEASNEQLPYLSWQVKSEIKFVIYITMARDIWN